MASETVSTWQTIVREDKLRREITFDFASSGLPETIDQPSKDVISIPRQFLSEAELTITEKPPEELVKLLAAGQLSSTDAVKAFMQRARIAQKLTNCITEMMPKRALERAEQLDQHLAEHGKPIGPLHGLPFSVKEHISIEGMDATAAMVAAVGHKAPFTASIVQILESQGAVFFARTSEPQSLMIVETSSNLYGYTSNPRNIDLNPGGSSGGEGALLALKGSPLGIGSDVGGSIRVPSAHNALYGLRPSVGRMPLAGIVAPTAGCETVMPVLGPMSPTLEGVKLFMQSILSTRPWESDISLHQIPWRDESAWLAERTRGDRKLRIGVLWDDGVVKPLPSCERALKEVVQKLQEIKEVEVVDFQQDHSSAVDLLRKLYFPDGGAKIKQDAEATGEPLVPLLSHLNDRESATQSHGIHEVWDMTMQREIYRHTYFQKWKESGVDLVLSPVAPAGPMQHDQSRYWGYTAIWNLLDYPSLAFPVTHLDPVKDAKPAGYTTRNPDEKWIWDCYDAEKQIGAPIGLQLTGVRLSDEKVVEAFTWIQEKTGLPFST